MFQSKGGIVLSTLINIENLKKYYPMKRNNPLQKINYVKAVDGVSFAIKEGETFGLVGESGCGKSTISNLIVNLLTPSDGKILFDGKDISKLNKKDKKQMKKDVQIIFQDSSAALNPKRKIGWLMEEPLVIYDIGDKEARVNHVEEMLNMVGLDKSYMDRYPHELSGGQRQRVNIGIALMLRPRFVIADEAVSALDVSVQSQILNLMKSLQRQLNLTFLFISHNLSVVEYMSDRLGVMYLGRLVETGYAKEIYENPLHPYTKALFSAIPNPNKRNNQRIVLEGELPDLMAPPLGCPFHTRCFNAEKLCAEKTPSLKEIKKGRSVCCHFVKQ